jgi:hypothetical protein
MRDAPNHGKVPKENDGGTWERFLIRLGIHQKYFTVKEIAKELDVSREEVNVLIEHFLLRDGWINEVNGRQRDYEWVLTPKGRRQLLNDLSKLRLPQEVAQAHISAESDSDFDRIKVDYEQTLATYRMLADIRFKLLAFVPTISGAAITFLSSKTAQAEPQTSYARNSLLRSTELRDP